MPANHTNGADNVACLSVLHCEMVVRQSMCVCRVAPVYRHIFPLSTAPTLSIIGLPWKVVPFPEFEVQAKWIARVLSKRVHLPSMDAMQAEVQQFYADLEQQEVPARCGQLPEPAVFLVL